jgi:hypothetical protein
VAFTSALPEASARQKKSAVEVFIVTIGVLVALFVIVVFLLCMTKGGLRLVRTWGLDSVKRFVEMRLHRGYLPHYEKMV